VEGEAEVTSASARQRAYTTDMPASAPRTSSKITFSIKQLVGEVSSKVNALRASRAASWGLADANRLIG
jgi:hypothetical protein